MDLSFRLFLSVPFTKKVAAAIAVLFTKSYLTISQENPIVVEIVARFLISWITFY